MYTCCPSCQTIFRLTTHQLAQAGGRTRCGVCRLVYNAVDCLYEDLDAARAARVQDGRSPEDQAETGTGIGEPRLDDQAASDADERPPEKLRTPVGGWTRGSLSLTRVFGGLVVVFLVLFLAGQWVFFNRAALAREQGWRPALQQFCRVLQCRLPLSVDLSQIELLNRDVRLHPRARQALLVNAALVNRADFIQPYPVIELSFSDPGGKTVALRRFRPKEYMNDVYVINRGMPPGKPIPVVLEIQDPGLSALSYQFGFL